MVDNLTPEQRSRCMSRIRSKDTVLEVRVRSAIYERGLRFRKHVRNLPGCPDIVFPHAKLAVFIDGDFWHGYDFENWSNRVEGYWKQKIEGNRERDIRYTEDLHKLGWQVIRIWQHEFNENFSDCIDRIVSVVRSDSRRAK